MKKWQRHLLLLVVGFSCGIVGWAGVSGLVGLAIYQLTKAGKVNISYDTGFLICVIVGGFFGCIPLGMIGADWVSRKWPNEEKSKARRAEASD